MVMDNETLELFSMELRDLTIPRRDRPEYGGLFTYGFGTPLPDIGGPPKLWVWHYDRVLGGSGVIVVTYQRATGEFRFEDKVTTDPDEALSYVKKRFEAIPEERKADIIEDASRGRGKPRELVMENIRRISEERPNSGPMEAEIEMYEEILYGRLGPTRQAQTSRRKG